MPFVPDMQAIPAYLEPNQRDDIGGLEGVDVETIKAAWSMCRVQMRAAQASIRSARREFLHAGFGTDHPMCKQLDSYDASMEQTWQRFLR